MPKLTVSQAATRLGVTRQRVHALAASGKLGRVFDTGTIKLLSGAGVERYATGPKSKGGRPRKAGNKVPNVPAVTRKT
jgi:excisionase family DNA binding protein